MKAELVTEPNAHSEFEVQAYLWNELRSSGFNVYGEVKTVQKENNKPAVCRFDIAEFSKGKLAGIVEVKSSAICHRSEGGWSATRQGARYASFGVPVVIIYGMDHAIDFAASAKRLGRIPY